MIVVAATAMGSFLTLRYQFSYGLRTWKYVILFLAGLSGLYGWVAGCLLTVLYLGNLRSMGVPYLAPLAPLDVPDLLSSTVSRPPRPGLVWRARFWRPMDRRRGSRGTGR